MRPRPHFDAVLLLAAALGAGTPGRAAPPARPGFEDVRGIVVSCHRWGYEWASPAMRETLDTLPGVGANWVAIHPYARVSRATGEVLWFSTERTDHIESPARWAHERGLRILVTPHLAHWGQFAWRGAIGFDDDGERWERFRSSYAAWITHLARVAARAGVDLLVVGSELRQTEGMAGFWRGLIRDVRAVYPGPLSYASNWDDFERVPFWRDLDYIGVQAYFPLSQAEDPSPDEIRAGWRDPVARMTRVSRDAGRPVLITEVGYTASPRAAAEPWVASRGPGPTAVQERCLRIALEVAHESPAIAGLFVWKWFPTPGEAGPGDFTVQTRGFKQLLASAWARGGAGKADQAPACDPEPGGSHRWENTSPGSSVQPMEKR